MKETVLFKQTQNRSLIILVILLSGDIELNPGPTNKSMYPCAMCDLPVTWVFVVTIVVCGLMVDKCT
jgi:hypothetical protein